MANSNGKAARSHGGNRFDLKRARRKAKHHKVFTNNKMTPEDYRSMKLSERKALARAS